MLAVAVERYLSFITKSPIGTEQTTSSMSLPSGSFYLSLPTMSRGHVGGKSSISPGKTTGRKFFLSWKQKQQQQHRLTYVTGIQKKTEQFHFNLQPCHVRCCRIVFAGLVLQDLSPPNEKCIPFPRNVPAEAPCSALHQDNHNSFISFLLRCLTRRCWKAK